MALGGGCEIAMACDVRIAGTSASFGQPEINLGIIPGFGGTQRLPRLVGPAKALEMNTIGDPISAEDAFQHGLVNRVVADHELFDAALAWARKVAGQAPVAIEQIKRVSHGERPRRGPGRRARRVPARVLVRGRARGHRRVHREAKAGVQGPVSAERLAELIVSSGPVVALTGAGISVPSGIPDFRTPGKGIWENVDPMEVAHISVWRRDPERFWSFYGQRFALLDGKQPNGAHFALVELERRGLLSGVITQNIDGLHAAAGTAGSDRGAWVDPDGFVLVVRGVVLAGRDAAARRGPALRLRRGSEAGRGAVRRVPAGGGDGAGVRRWLRRRG